MCRWIIGVCTISHTDDIRKRFWLACKLASLTQTGGYSSIFVMAMFIIISSLSRLH